MKNNGVIFLKDWKLLVSSLSPENQLEFWDMFTNYEYGVEQTCDNQYLFPIWTFIKAQMDNMKDKYNEKIVNRNQINGAKGGRPKKETQTENENPKNPVGLNETQKSHNEKDNVKNNEKDNNNVNVLLEKETKSDLQSEEAPKELFEDDKQPDSGERKKVPPKKESDEVEINYRFDSKIFIAQWNLYKVFRKKKHRFTFLDNDSENRKLTELFNLSNEDEKFAIKIIQNSIDNGYKGLFLPKNLNNGKSTHNNSNNGFTKTTIAGSNATSGKTSATTAIARQLAKITAGNSESGDFTTDA